MKKRTPFLFGIPLILAALAVLTTVAYCHDAYLDPAVAGPAYQLQGEFAGKDTGLQVIALGGDEFEAVLCPGGLPGDGWDGKKPRLRAKGKVADGTISFAGEGWAATSTADSAIVTPQGKTSITLDRVERKSPTLGKAAPEGAVVLFDGSEASRARWEEAKVDGDLLKEGVTTTDKFSDFTLHLEFRLPFMPTARGQARANSGLYLTGRYEVQMLDSFGLAGKDNECGGIYKVAEPNVNMCFPPLAWQTYDVDFTAAKFESGKKVKNAVVTVRHNGVIIHENVELPGPTGGARLKSEEGPGPIFLQDHGNPVRYRNIWIVPRS